MGDKISGAAANPALYLVFPPIKIGKRRHKKGTFYVGIRTFYVGKGTFYVGIRTFYVEGQNHKPLRHNGYRISKNPNRLSIDN